MIRQHITSVAARAASLPPATRDNRAGEERYFINRRVHVADTSPQARSAAYRYVYAATAAVLRANADTSQRAKRSPRNVYRIESADVDDLDVFSQSSSLPALPLLAICYEHIQSILPLLAACLTRIYVE